MVDEYIMTQAKVHSESYSELDKQWQAVSRLLLGGETGQLSDYAAWLYEGNGPRIERKSSLSGKPVVFSSERYPSGAPCASFDEVDLDMKYPLLSINEIKDIDSLISAVSSRVMYSGNMVLGNSDFVDKSSAITDCFHVYHSERVAFSKYIAYSTRGGYSEYIFGCFGFGPAHFAVKSGAIWDVTRSFCSTKSEFSSDIYFSHGLSSCQECIFCFNLHGKRHAIGNLPLDREKYALLKKKLLSEMREELLKKKRLPSLSEMFSKEKPDYSGIKKAASSSGFGTWKAEKTDKSQIEAAFSKTAKLIFGKLLGPIDAYSHLLSKNSQIRLDKAASCVSGQTVLLSDYAWILDYPKNRLLTQDEANFLGEKLSISKEEAASVSFQNASGKLSKIAYFTPLWLAGKLRNNIDSPLNIDSSDCYCGALYMLSKYSAFCFSPRSCEYSFGCRENREASFCINAHFSTKSSRCFEVDNANNCTGCYFCHNVENVHDSMFCFNVKNKRYAIGNVEVGREKFLKAKDVLLEWLVRKLETEKDLSIDTYNIR